MVARTSQARRLTRVLDGAAITMHQQSIGPSQLAASRETSAFAPATVSSISRAGAALGIQPDDECPMT
jgi:hypothetical protein